MVRSSHDREIDGGGHGSLQRGQSLSNAIHRVNDIGVRLPEDNQQTGGLPSTNPAARMFWTESSTSATSDNLMAAPLW